MASMKLLWGTSTITTRCNATRATVSLRHPWTGQRRTIAEVSDGRSRSANCWMGVWPFRWTCRRAGSSCIVPILALHSRLPEVTRFANGLALATLTCASLKRTVRWRGRARFSRARTDATISKPRTSHHFFPFPLCATFSAFRRMRISLSLDAWDSCREMASSRRRSLSVSTMISSRSFSANSLRRSRRMSERLKEAILYLGT